MEFTLCIFDGTNRFKLGPYPTFNELVNNFSATRPFFYESDSPMFHFYLEESGRSLVTLTVAGNLPILELVSLLSAGWVEKDASTKFSGIKTDFDSWLIELNSIAVKEMDLVNDGVKLDVHEALKAFTEGLTPNEYFIRLWGLPKPEASNDL